MPVPPECQPIADEIAKLKEEIESLKEIVKRNSITSEYNMR